MSSFHEREEPLGSRHLNLKKEFGREDSAEKMRTIEHFLRGKNPWVRDI